MVSENFSIEVKNMHWLGDGQESLYDVCSHGDVTVKIGNEIFQENEMALNASALYLLRTLTADYLAEFDNPMRDFALITCCGYTLVAVPDSSDVVILSCPFGIDFSVEHVDSQVKITTLSEETIVMDFEEYQRTIYAFADEVKSFYDNEPPRLFREDYEQQGYERFWGEWNRRRM